MRLSSPNNKKIMMMHQNGQWELFPTPKNGSCLFASIRRGVAAPEEYRNNHLRYQLVHFLCQHADFMVNVLDLHLSANYGMDILSKEDFQKAEKDGTLTKAQREAQTLPGPFSYVEYLENLLNESFWGDHGGFCLSQWCGRSQLLHLLQKHMKNIEWGTKGGYPILIFLLFGLESLII